MEKLKERYITENNIKSKSQIWLKDIGKYTRKRENFQLDISDSALLVIDMQNFFLSSRSHAFIPSSKAIVSNIKQLVEAYRKYRYPIVFTRYALTDGEDPGIMGRWWRDVVMDGEYFSQIIQSLKPRKDEFVIRKSKYSIFYNTELEKFLKAKGVKSIVMTGVMTHLCCETAAREAFVRDLEVYFVIDCTATINEELHLASLKTLAHGFAIPVITEDVLKAMRI